MSTFGPRLWQELLNAPRSTPTVSVYLPTHRAGEQTRQDRIRLKNELSKAQRELEYLAHSPSYVRMILEPAQGLLADEDFWQHQDLGLVLLLRDGRMYELRLPYAFDELCVVSDVFHLKPLLPLWGGNGRFYVLSLSLKNTRIFAGDRYHLDELDIEQFPKALTDVVGEELEPPTLQAHSGRSPSGGRAGDAIFHGQGAGDDDRHLEIERFLRAVDHGFGSLADARRWPLVLAGVDEIVGHFRKVSEQTRVIPETLRGNFDHQGAAQLHGPAWKLARSWFVDGQNGDRDRFRELEGTGLASAQIESILEWARHGRVETLFVDPVYAAWGRLDAGDRAHLHAERQPGDLDLVDRAAVWSLQKGATVHAGSADELGMEHPVAAILRY